MPVIGLRDVVPGPVGDFEILENNPRVGVLLSRIAPNVKVALPRAGLGSPRTLKPRVLIRSVIEHQFGDHAQAAPVGLAEKDSKVLDRAVRRD